MARSDDTMVAGAVSLPASGRRLNLGRLSLQVAALFIGVYLLLPTLVVVPMALTKSQLLQFPPEWISLHAFGDYFRDGQWIESTFISLKVALLAMAIAVAVGTLSSIALHRSRFPGKGIILGVILAPIVVPLVVLGLADYVFFLRLQLIGSWIQIGLAHSLLVTPYVFVSVQASLAGLDPALVRSARSLGAGPVSVLRHVYWPTIRPGVVAGAVFAFAVSFDEVVIALFLQGPSASTLPVRMFTSIQFDLTPKIAAIATLLLGLATATLAAQGALVLRRHKTAQRRPA